jgi:anaerobic magnesium-protoporphyrin IX monomethyl ester cyclase
MKKEYRKILLLKVPHCVHPDAVFSGESFRQKHTFRPIPSFALAVLCAFIEKNSSFGYGIKAVDVNTEAYQKPGVPIDIREYPLLLEDIIKSQVYDVLAVSTMFVFNARWLKMAVELSRLYHPEAKIIAGGGYPTIFPRKCLENYQLDNVVIGEGETALLHLLNRYNFYRDKIFEEKFPFDGCGGKNEKGEIEIVPKKSYLDMNDVPMPAWNYLGVEKYFEKSGERVLPMEAVRGCPYRCTFCNTQLTWGYRLRYKKVDKLIEEMKELERKYRVKLHFIDDNRSVDRSWMLDFLDSVIREQITLESAPSSFHANHLDEKLLDLLKTAGVKTIGIGVESGSQQQQKRLKKNLDLSHVKKIVKLIKSKGLLVHINYMVGFPHETVVQIKETIDLARELKAHSNQFLILVPYPGTEIYEEAKRDLLLTFDESCLDSYEPRGTNFLRSDEWTYEQLAEMIYDANIDLNFLNNSALSEEENRNWFLGFLKNLLLRIPGHVIVLIVLGYLLKNQDKSGNWEMYYLEAIKNLGIEAVFETFHKYLSWKHPIIDEFNSYCEANNTPIT